jgi:hypothetical protein
MFKAVTRRKRVKIRGYVEDTTSTSVDGGSNTKERYSLRCARSRLEETISLSPLVYTDDQTKMAVLARAWRLSRS